MNDIVIQAEGLGKSYLIGHKANEKYATLRDAIANKAKRYLFKSRSSCNEALKEVEEFWALEDVSFKVKRGERIGIIGRNGAGKSTLLKILSRITEPTSGKIAIKGRVSSLLEVGTGFHPELTGRENIYLNGAILGMTRREIKAKFDEIVDFAETEKFLDTPVKRYSSGMYVRLAFAVAAHLEPEILVVDEVLAVGDSQFQEKCLGKMGEISREGRTLLFVSHNMSAIAALCDQAILLNSGKIETLGCAKDVINAYTLTIASASDIDLTDRKHVGKQEFAELVHLSIRNENNNPSVTFIMGQTMVARISFKCKKFMKSAEVGFKISSISGLAIHYFSSSWEGLKSDLLPGEYDYEVRVPNIMLFPGKYVLGAWILKDGCWSDDSVQGVSTIEILSADVTGNFGKLKLSNTFDRYVNSGCETYIPSKWRMIIND